MDIQLPDFNTLASCKLLVFNKLCINDRHTHPLEICDPILEAFDDGVHLECLPRYLPLPHGHAAQRHQLGGVNSGAEETTGAAQNHRSARGVGVELLETHAQVPGMGKRLSSLADLLFQLCVPSVVAAMLSIKCSNITIM